jgi:hypothetical protein
LEARCQSLGQQGRAEGSPVQSGQTRHSQRRHPFQRIQQHRPTGRPCTNRRIERAPKGRWTGSP